MPSLGWSRYGDVNPVPTRPLADELATTPSGLTSTVYVYVGVYLYTRVRTCVEGKRKEMFYLTTHSTHFVTRVVGHWLEREIAQWVHHE